MPELVYHLDDFVLLTSRLLYLQCERLPHEKQESQRAKADACHQSRY